MSAGWSGGCSLRHSRGATACSNRNTISDLGLNAAVLAALRTHLDSPQVEAWLTEATTAAERAHARVAQAKDERSRLEAEVASTSARVERVVESMASFGHSDTLARKLRTEEEKLRSLREQISRLAVHAPRKAPLKVTAGRVLVLLKNLEKFAATRPAQARAALGAVVEAIVLVPVDGRLKATLTLQNKTASIAGGRLDSDGCGARI